VKLLLVGWDTASWSAVRPLVERGWMPQLHRLLSEGAAGELRSVRPAEPIAIWMSIATGKRPWKHGVVSPLEVLPDRNSIRATRRASAHGRTLWSILSEAGFRTHSFGWPASHPAELINGISVSDQFLTGRPGAISPRDRFDDLRELVVRPEEIDAASVLTLVPDLTAHERSQGGFAEGVARFLAATASQHAVATWGLEHEPWDFAAVRYGGLDAMAEHFSRAASFPVFMEGAYRFYDMMLGRLFQLAGRETSVLLLSDHGVAVAAGPAFAAGGSLVGAGACDVAPTVLSLFGVPAGRDMDGRPWRRVLREIPAAVEPRVTWESQADAAPAADEDEASIAHLRALGYHEQPDEYARLAADELDQEHQLRLAEAYADAGRHERAVTILEALTAGRRSTVRERSALAEAYFHAGRRAECRRAIEALAGEGVDTALLHVGLAALDVAEGRRESALAHLADAQRREVTSAAVWEATGRVALRAKQWEQARHAFSMALAMDAGLAEAHDGAAVVCLLGGDPSGAETHARRAVEAAPLNASAVYHLAIALSRLGRVPEAIAALRDSELDRGGNAAVHRLFAELYEADGDTAAARQHRQRALEQSFMNHGRQAAAGRKVPREGS
jgi:tetratricopeptide (TPR) repeat protein